MEVATDEWRKQGDQWIGILARRLELQDKLKHGALVAEELVGWVFLIFLFFS